MDALSAARKRGIDLYEKNDYRGAEAAFREVIRIFPDNAGSHYNLGLALEYQKRWSEAVDAYREAMRLNPNYSKARDNLRQAEAELRKEREWQARREEERRERAFLRPEPDRGLAHGADERLHRLLLTEHVAREPEREVREPVPEPIEAQLALVGRGRIAIDGRQHLRVRLGLK